MTETIFGKYVFDLEEAGLMTYTAASHQGAIQMFQGAVIPQIFLQFYGQEQRRKCKVVIEPQIQQLEDFQV